MEKGFIHDPVLVEKILKIFSAKFEERGLGNQNEKQVFLDCTLGLGGHSKKIFEQFNVSLLGIDRDVNALEIADTRLKDCFAELKKQKKVQGEYQDNVFLFHRTFDDISSVLSSLKINSVDGVLFDLGVSSMQIDDDSRGFSYLSKSDLDMRMNTDDTLTAYDVVNDFEEEKLSKIIKIYGEERYAKVIARKIVETRKVDPIRTSKDLVSVIEKTNRYRDKKELNSAIKRVFQALRIYVNNELEILVNGLIEAVKSLSVGGIIIVESYHSLEDKIVKKIFDLGASSAMNDLPFNLSGDEPFLENITKKPIRADESEIESNSRSHSVMLRAMKKNKEINPYIEEKYELLKRSYNEW